MAEVDHGRGVYPIGVVQKLTGLSGRQIRYYEQVGLLRPQRTKGNQRLYSPQEVELLLRIKELLNRGLNIEGVKAHLASGRDPLLEANTPAGEAAPASAAPGSPPRPGEDEGEYRWPVFTPQLDHDYIITQMRAGVKLASLFPVNNQAELVRVLQQHRDRQREASVDG